MSGYRAGLVRKYGETKVVLLESMKNDVRKYSDFEYEALIKHYQFKIKELLALKNVEISCLTK